MASIHPSRPARGAIRRRFRLSYLSWSSSGLLVPVGASVGFVTGARMNAHVPWLAARMRIIYLAQCSSERHVSPPG